MSATPQPAYRPPSHVPAELFLDTAIHEIALGADDPFIGAAKLHDGPDIVFMSNACRGHPGWVPTRHAIFQEIFLDTENFSSAENIQSADLLGVDWKMNPLEIDPPNHTAYRHVLQSRFSPAAITAFEPLIREVCRDLMSKFEEKGSCDFVTDFGILFPSYVFLKLVDLPLEQLPQFLIWEKMFTRSPDPAVRADGARSIMHYLEKVVAERQAEPKGDLISHIANASVDGRKLNHGEIMGMCMVLYFGGLDTVLNSLGWYMRHLAADQALQTRLRDHPEDISNAVQEFLRAFGITLTKRNVTKDLVFHGVQMKAGDYVALPTCLASRDPLQWENPHEINIDRRGPNLTLASGIHNCLGAHLARREIKVVLEEFLARFRNIRLQEGAEVNWHAQGNFGVDNLPITWDRA